MSLKLTFVNTLLACAAVSGMVAAQPLPHPAPGATASPSPGATTRPDGNALGPPVRHQTQEGEDNPLWVEPAPPSHPGVGGVSIVGLNYTQSVARLRPFLKSQLNRPLTLNDGERRYPTTPRQLGATIPYTLLINQAWQQKRNIPLRYTVDADQLRPVLVKLAARVQRAPAPMALDVDHGKVVLRGHDGVTLATEGSLWRVKKALEQPPLVSDIALDVQRQPAAGNNGQLQQFRYLVIEFSTPYDSGLRGRTHNLGIAARQVDGFILPSGGVFSTNRAIGPREASAGWQEAKMYVSGQIVTGVGAGICQCASTLYNAALLSGFKIVERHQHYFRVMYVAPSRDATIYWGSKDMRFRNTMAGPIYIQTFLRHERFHVRFYGTEPNPHHITIQSEVLSRRNGTSSQAFRVWHTAAGDQRERLSRDYYYPHPPATARRKKKHHRKPRPASPAPAPLPTMGPPVLPAPV